MSLFPPADRPEVYATVARDEAELAPGVRQILVSHGLRDLPHERFADGSLPVYAVGPAHVLKLYPPCYAFEQPIERACLDAVSGRLGIPTPTVLASGELDGWPYLFMSRLQGRSLAAVWEDLDRADQERVVRQLGEALARLHRLPLPNGPIPDRPWPEFLAAQRATVLDRQRRRGLPEPWLRQVEPYLGSVELELPKQRVLLHTEVMREHLLVEQTAQGWRLSGLFDFEPAMLGGSEYEMASVGIFVTCGDGELLRALLDAYGLPSSELTVARSRRYLAYALLHIYSDLAWYLRRLHPPPEVATLELLAERWFGFDRAG